MTKIETVLGVFLIISLVLQWLLFSFGTEIGKWGRRNILARNLISLTAVGLATAYSIILATSLDRDSMLYALIIAAMSAYLIRFNAIELMGIMKETSEDLITENMSDVKVEPFGDYGESRILIGMANGKHNRFIMRGVDKILAKRIKKGNIKQVTITYYASTHRLYAIQESCVRTSAGKLS